MDTCAAEARLWEIENEKSLKNDPFNEALDGARAEMKGFKERIELVLRTRNIYK